MVENKVKVIHIKFDMRSKAKVVLGAITGNIVEYYDFGIYAIFATIIGRLFFPSNDSETDRILAFGVFSIGFMMRPLGGLVFGYIGDNFGRRKALIASIIGMSLSTLGIGLLPSYDSIGIAAPIILVLIRMIQGLCIGGEGTGSAIYILEHMNKSKASLMASLVMTSNIVGTLIANVFAMILEITIGINDYTWRYCFFIGALMGCISLYFRIRNDETPEFKKMREDKQKIIKTPVTNLIQRKKYAVLSIFAIASSATSMTYIVRGYLNSCFTDGLHYSTTESLQYTIFTLTCLTILFPIFGLLTDRFSTIKILNFGVFFILISVVFVWYLIVYTHGISQYIGLFLIAVMGAAMGAPAYPHAIQSFPPEIRYSGVALGWNLGNAIFGGTTPMICTILFESFGPIAPAFYLMFTASTFLMLRAAASIYIKNKKA